MSLQMKSPAIVILCVILSILQTVAADWAQWRGANRDGHVPQGVAVPAKLPDDPRILWRVKIGDGLSSPVIAGGKVFYSDNQEGREVLHAVNATDAKELWHADIDKVHGDSQSLPGPRCTPVVDGDRVYAQSCRGELHCLKVSDGSLLWKVNYTTDFSAIFIGEKGQAQGATRHGNNGSPLVDGTDLFAQVGGTNGESVVAFDKTSGKVIWKSQNDQSSYAAPITATIDGTKQLVVFTTDGVIGLAPRDGRLLWRSPMKTTFARHATTPVVIGDIVMVSSHEVGLVGIKVSHEGGNWQATRAWTSKDSAINFSSPVGVGEYLYGLGPNKNFICVEAKTGKQMWSQPGYINTSGGQAYASFLVMDKNILSLTDGGQLVLFAADSSAFKEISKVQVCAKNWCNPAYADGKLYLRDAHELMGVALLP